MWAERASYEVVWSAYVDESGSNRAKDPGTYILAAAVTEDAYVDHVSEVVSGLRLPAQRKLHWSDENPKRQELITKTIADLPLEHLVVVRTGRDSDRPERRRRKCLEELFIRFDELGVSRATFESRGRKDDRRDLDVLQAFRASKRVSGSLRIYHQAGPVQPMLWIPDAVCGAVTADRTGDAAYLRLLDSCCTIYTI